ncbi:hypothetical protein [Legionella drancourtii]|uniref:Uncharacterized protein n=1 Tax=Legionella drancourtii LLAP12 TaxID=658187 RepID=G9EIQ9_9GAMM|nr:hypothetical protein [Legionella drancourtii]EHL32827.1 hypothetical protein LDG_5065 [Legionella drancourtii LLAP12]
MGLLFKLTGQIARDTALTLASAGTAHAAYYGLSSFSGYAKNKYLLWNQPALKIKNHLENKVPSMMEEPENLSL